LPKYNYSRSVLVHASTVVIAWLLVVMLVTIKLVGLLDLLLNALQGLGYSILELQVEVLVMVDGQMSHMVLLHISKSDWIV
jgi:hypothetical protein